jgi:DNA-binding MarR family transcriptional regulator
MIEKRLEESLILHLIALGDKLKKRREIISQELGISPQQWLIMLHLANDPNIPYLQRNPQKKSLMASEIAESLDSSRPNVSNLINILMERGLVEQVEDEDDRRRKRLTLSNKGQGLIDMLQPQRMLFNEKLFESFNEVDKKQFLNFIDLCSEQLDEYLLHPEQVLAVVQDL